MHRAGVEPGDSPASTPEIISSEMGATWGASRPELGVVQSVDRTLAIVDLLLRHGEAMTAREIASQIDINRTTAHRLLNTLMHRGWIEKTPSTAAYRVSTRHLVLSHLTFDERDVLSTMRPALAELSERSRETVHVGVLDGIEIVHVDKIDSPERVGVSSTIGTRSLAHPSSLGKAILAASPPERAEEYIARMTQQPGVDATFDATWLREELGRTRTRGYSIDDEEDSLGVRCIGSAILAGDGEPLFAVSITGPSGRFTRDRAETCAPALMDVTANLSTAFGWLPPPGDADGSGSP